ncbi:MAG: MATE family efflux transporter [Eubacterium sp.]
MKQNNKLESMPVPKLIWNVSFPLMISMLVQSLYNIVDGIFVARINENALTATSLAYPVQMLMIAVSVGTGVGVNALLSRTLGQKDSNRVKQVAINGLFSAFIGCVPFVLLGIIAVKPFLSLYTDDTEILNDSVSYLKICMIFSIGIFIATTGERCLQSTGKTWLSMIAQTAGALCNIILDPILIFGCLGLPAMGVKGAAIATVAGQWLAGIISLILNAKYNKSVPIKLKNFKINGVILKDIYKVGLPTMVMQACGSVMVLAMNKLLYSFSSTAVAFFGVYYKLQNFLYMPLNGLAQSLIPIVGYNFGAKNNARIKQSYIVTVRRAAIIMLIGTAVFCLVPKTLLGFFSAGEAMLEIGVPALRIISLSFVFTGVTVVTGYYFSGLGNGLVNMFSTLLRQLIILIPVAYLFASQLGINSTWYAFLIAEIIACVFAVLAYKRKKIS